MISFHADSQSGLERFAAKIAFLCKPGDVIALYGDLGMGKTVFSRAFIRVLGHKDEEVPSPTFTLVQTYDATTADRTETTIWHFDLYRLKQADEIYEIGFEEALSDGISLIEWPERAEKILPKNRLNIHIKAGKTHEKRLMDILPNGASWEERTNWETYVRAP